MKRVIYFLLFYLCLSSIGSEVYAQQFVLTNHRRSSTFNFRIVRKLIVVSLKINDKGPFNFVLDTGVGLLVITDPSLLDSIEFTNKRTVKLAGMGEGVEYEAYFTGPVKVDLPGITSENVGAVILKEDHLNLSNYAGIPIQGLLGYEFFKKLTVEFNFNDSTVKAYPSGKIRKSKRYEHIPITIENNKPYMNANIRFWDNSIRNVKLIIDIGAGHALSLENDATKSWPTSKSISANLGMGFTGPINGEVGRVSKLSIGKFGLVDVLSSFPNAVPKLSETHMRDGNLGFDALKRFNLIFDYENNSLFIKSRGALREPFEHDMSGLEYFAVGTDLKRVFISRVEDGSPGDAIGLAENDELVAVNFKPVTKMALEEIDELFRSGNGRNILLEVNRNNKNERVVITLKRRI